jgi:hypothetical protein
MKTMKILVWEISRIKLGEISGNPMREKII